jgi:hypothetical protein
MGAIIQPIKLLDCSWFNMYLPAMFPPGEGKSSWLLPLLLILLEQKKTGLFARGRTFLQIETKEQPYRYGTGG